MADSPPCQSRGGRPQELKSQRDDGLARFERAYREAVLGPAFMPSLSVL